MPSPRVRRVRLAVLVAAAFVALYAAISRGVFLYGDDVLMFQVAQAIAERGEVAVTSTAPPRDATAGIPGAEGRRYAKYGLATSLVALPFYVAGDAIAGGLGLPESRDAHGNLRTGPRVFAIGLTNAVVGGVAVALTLLLALELGASATAATSAACILGAGTLWAHYAATFLSEPLAGALLAAAFLAALRAARAEGPRSPWTGLALSGAAAGALVATKVVLAAALPPLALWAVVVGRKRSGSRGALAAAAAWGAPFAAGLAVVAVYDLARFGSPLATGYGGEARKFTTPFLDGLAGLLVSPAKGIVWYAPAVLLAVAGVVRARRGDSSATRDAALAFSATVALVLGVYSKYYQWYGGGAWGPRFLVPLLPVGIAFAALWFDALGGPKRSRAALAAAKGATAALVAAGLVTTLAGIVVPFDADPSKLVSAPKAFAAVVWDVSASPLVENVRRLPAAVGLAAAKLASTGGAHATGDGLAEGHVPDAAFARYGSHALLRWSRAGLALFALLAGAAAVVARRTPR